MVRPSGMAGSIQSLMRGCALDVSNVRMAAFKRPSSAVGAAFRNHAGIEQNISDAEEAFC